MSKRLKYNYAWIINDLELVQEYDQFVENTNLKRHLKGKKDISFNRLARAFLLHFQNSFKKQFGFECNVFLPCFILGHEENFKDYYKRTGVHW